MFGETAFEQLFVTGRVAGPVSVTPFAAGATVLVTLCLSRPERPMGYGGPRALLDAAFTLGLLTIVLVLAGALGQRMLRWLRIAGITGPERIVFALPLGLGVTA